MASAETHKCPATSTSSWKGLYSVSPFLLFNVPTTTMSFLPDFTEHPKPKRRRKPTSFSSPPSLPEDNDNAPPQPPPSTDDDIAFFHDFGAGGVAGCASVMVGHPFDTVKVRMQASSRGTIRESMQHFGGVSSLFRGMTAPLGAAAIVNAVVFGSYGLASRSYDERFGQYWGEIDAPYNHDPWQKSLVCGSFAGAVQCLIICPMEHVKIRLQTASNLKGPWQAITHITQFGWHRLYQGWWSTALREIPAFGVYFCSYDYLKDQANRYFDNEQHSWLASAMAGGCAGSITWAMVYPVDVIKTRVQTAPLDAPFSKLRMIDIGRSIYRTNPQSLFRGLGITLIRAFPVNGTIFPVYEFTLQSIKDFGY